MKKSPLILLDIVNRDDAWMPQPGGRGVPRGQTARAAAGSCRVTASGTLIATSRASFPSRPNKRCCIRRSLVATQCHNARFWPARGSAPVSQRRPRFDRGRWCTSADMSRVATTTSDSPQEYGCPTPRHDLAAATRADQDCHREVAPFKPMLNCTGRGLTACLAFR